MKYIVGVCVILAVLVILCFWRINYLVEENTVLTGENNGFRIELKRRNENVLALSERNKKLEQAVASDKSGFDWSYNTYNSPISVELRKQCKSCPPTTD